MLKIMAVELMKAIMISSPFGILFILYPVLAIWLVKISLIEDEYGKQRYTDECSIALYLPSIPWCLQDPQTDRQW